MPEFVIQDTDLNKISELLLEKNLKDISLFDPAYIKKSVDLRLKTLGLKDAVKYYQLLCSNENESALLLKSLFNNFSCFFRDGLSFSYLEQNILPSLAARKSGGELRIWSACCAAGQEAYSLAILISDFSEMRRLPLRRSIIATDISEDALSSARRAVYDENTVSNVKLGHLNKYFKISKNEYSIIPSLKQQVQFAHYDLLDSSTAFPPESIYGSFDLVMCTNLLIYYRPAVRKRIVFKLINSLSEGGYLIAGETETTFFDSPALQNPFCTPGNIFINSRGRGGN